eukprot:Ihof_evm6s158 gene=Ihof_evmTU6s158
MTVQTLKRIRVEGGKDSENEVQAIAQVAELLKTLKLEENTQDKEDAVNLLLHALPQNVRRSVGQKGKVPTINPLYQLPSFKAKIREAYVQKKNWSGATMELPSEAQFIGDPYPSAVLPNFLAGHHGMTGEFLSEVAKDLETEFYGRRSNDLLDFYQTNDLKTCTKPNVIALRHMLNTELRAWMEDLLDTKFTPDYMDLFSAKYNDKGTLVCHDDRLEGRRVAFILYMVDNDYSKEDGGALDLFNVDGSGSPTTISHSLIPAWNSFAFFEVSNLSFHQVAQVVGNKTRLSITGWFHGAPSAPLPLPKVPNYICEAAEPLSSGPIDSEIDLSDWINPDYLRETSQSQIESLFLDQSSVQLQNFFRKDKYALLKAALEESQRQEAIGDAATFHLVGPPQMRRYSRGITSPGIMTEFTNFLRSKAFWSYVNKLTNLNLSNGTLEMRRFVNNDYTLLLDKDQVLSTEALDVQFTCLIGTNAWDLEFGGFTSYHAGKEELLTVLPQ